MFQPILSRLREVRARIPLSPAETSVAMFVLCALVASLAFRAWNAMTAPVPRPIPSEFAALDSTFAARSRAQVINASATDEGTFYSLAHTSCKTLPAPHSIDLNTAGADQLRHLPGVGPALASRIIAFRHNTPLRKPEDLMRVEGIGKRKYARMQPFITIQ